MPGEEASANSESFLVFQVEGLGVSHDAVSFDDEVLCLDGSNAAATMFEMTDVARATAGNDTPSRKERVRVDGRHFSDEASIAEVEIASAIGVKEAARHAAFDDFGIFINSMLVEGEVRGGVVAGIAQATNQRVACDEHSELLTTIRLDRGVPRAAAAPCIVATSEPLPLTANPRGTKGCAKACADGALAAFTNADHHTLKPVGIGGSQWPTSPEHVWQAILDADSTVATE